MCGSFVAKFEGNQLCPLHPPPPRPPDILTVRIHFKVWQRASRRAAGRQIKQGPSQQVVLRQIGCDSVQPPNNLPT